MSEDLQVAKGADPRGVAEEAPSAIPGAVETTKLPTKWATKWTVGGGIICLAIATLIWLRPVHDALLCRSLLNIDAERICEALAAIGINYTVKDDAVYVSRKKVHAARLKVIESVSGSNDPLRFELVKFSRSTLSTDYTAALQGELEATIGSIDGVESARVLIETPGNLGRINGDRPLAVVVIYTTDSTKLTTEQIDVIQNLVASSTDCLTPREVTVSEARNSESLAEFTIESL